MARTSFCEIKLRILLGVWIFVFIGTWPQARGTCTIPNGLQTKWYRASDAAIISISASGLTGHTVTAGSTDFTSFDCFLSSADTFVFGLPSAVDGRAGPEFGYFCWKLTKLADNAYFLYELTAVATGTFENQRVHGQSTANIGDTPSTPVQNVVCTVDSTTVTPVMLYKLVTSTDTDVDVASLATSPAVQQCPDQLLADFSYTKDTTGCAKEVTTLAFCPGRKTATADYGTCAEKILYSEGGVLDCTGSFTKDSNTFVYLVNNDNSVDNSNYFRFVCLKFSETGTPGAVTVYPGDCSATSSHQLDLTAKTTCPVQTSTTVASVDTTQGITGVTPVGATTTDSSATTEAGGGGGDDSGSDVTTDSSNGVDIVPIIAGVVGAVVVVALVVVGIIVYKKVFAKRKKTISPSKEDQNANATEDDGNTRTSENQTSNSPPPVYDESTTAADNPGRTPRLPPLETVTSEKSAPLRA